MKQFIGTCVSLAAQALHDFDDSAKDISMRTFVKHIGKEQWKEWRTAFSMPLNQDWHVNYQKGIWEGRPAVCFFHSRIHHMFVDYSR